MKKPKRPYKYRTLIKAIANVKCGVKEQPVVALGQLEMRDAYYAFWARRGITDPPTY